MVADGAFSNKIDYDTISKFQRASKLHFWFKGYGNFAEWKDFSDWWSFIGKGLRLQPAEPACFRSILNVKLCKFV